MKIVLLTFCAAICTIFSCIAQKRAKPDSAYTVYLQTLPQLSIGGEIGLPTGQASQVYGTVLGASVKLEIPLKGSQLNFVGTIGISDFLLKYYYSGPAVNALYMPFEIGGKYYFNHKRIAYFEADLGVSSNINNNYTGSKNAFIYSPVIGVSAPTNNHKAAIDIGLRYEGRVESGGTVGQAAIRLAYRFGLKSPKK